MGFYHVNRTLKGMYFEHFNVETLVTTIPDAWIPDESWIAKDCLPTTCKYGELTKQQKLIFLGCLIDIPYIYGNNAIRKISQFTTDFSKKIYEEEYKRELVLIWALGVIFCYIHNYPLNSFEGIKDYDDTWMFVCSMQFPPVEYNKSISTLTEKRMGEEIAEFLTVVTGTEYQPKVELCEEYIKE